MNYLTIDYDHIPCKVTVHKHGVLVKKWSAKKPIDLVHSVIDNMDCSGFEKLKIKKTLEGVLNVFKPSKIRIVSKEP